MPSNDAYRLTWNPRRRQNREDIKNIRERGKPWIWGWRCGSLNIKIEVGNRIYLVRLGLEPKGIIAVGKALCVPYGPSNPCIKVEFEKLSEEPLIPWEELTRPPFDVVPWANQNLAVRVPANLSQALDERLFGSRQSLTAVKAQQPPLMRNQAPPRSGAGFGDSESNAIVEGEATKIVIRYYREKGWHIQDVSKKNLGYDLVCTKDRQEEHVEIKGISGPTQSFIITYNEYEQAKRDRRFVLFLVTSVLSAPEAHRHSRDEALSQFTFVPINYRATPSD